MMQDEKLLESYAREYLDYQKNMQIVEQKMSKFIDRKSRIEKTIGFGGVGALTTYILLTLGTENSLQKEIATYVVAASPFLIAFCTCSVRHGKNNKNIKLLIEYEDAINTSKKQMKSVVDKTVELIKNWQIPMNTASRNLPYCLTQAVVDHMYKKVRTENGVVDKFNY